MDKGSVLIVEDELWIAKDIKDSLLSEGFAVTDICMSVKEALASIQRTKPDLVFIDINLSGKMDGIALGEVLQEDDLIPYAYITSYTDQLTLERAKNTRPRGYIVKPFRSVDITTTAEIILNNFHKFNTVDTQGIPLPNTTEVPFKIRKTLHFIHRHLEDKISVATLAKISGWKEQHYILNFKKYVGATPYRYVLLVKINRAQALLRETKMPVVQIAHELGFSRHSNFSVNFKNQVGISAQEYRNKHSTL